MSLGKGRKHLGDAEPGLGPVLVDDLPPLNRPPPVLVEPEEVDDLAGPLGRVGQVGELRLLDGHRDSSTRPMANDIDADPPAGHLSRAPGRAA